jgi:signal transduction histidine kinase
VYPTLSPLTLAPRLHGADVSLPRCSLPAASKTSSLPDVEAGFTGRNGSRAGRRGFSPVDAQVAPDGLVLFCYRCSFSRGLACRLKRVAVPAGWHRACYGSRAMAGGAHTREARRHPTEAGRVSSWRVSSRPASLKQRWATRDTVAGESNVILNVNGDEGTRGILSDLLRQAGYDVREASSGEQALQLARESPQLIILDVGLPDLDGLEVCRRLKRDPRTGAIPVLQTSATHVSAERKVEGLDSGADGYLVQPVEPAELVATVRALLRARDAEANLKDAGIEWQRTFDAIAESAAILRADGRILRTNRALLNLVKAAEEEVADRSVRAVFLERLGIDDPILDVAASPTLERHATELRAGESWYRVVTDPILDERGQASRFVLVMTDITSLRGLADAERRRADELLEDNRRKDEFLAMLAHELRNPLNAIATATALQDRVDVTGADAIHVRATISRQIRQLSRLVDDLLDVSRLTRGRVQLRKEAIDLKSVLHEVKQMARPYLDARRQSLLLDLPDDPVIVDGDALRLGQALANLVSNASKFSDAERRILLRCEIDRGDATHPVVVVRVVDEGMGIEPSRLDSIFEPFVQGQTTLARSEGGLGIGLTIARRMIELHGGELTAHSAGLGTGTEFRVTLPLAQERHAIEVRPTALDGYLRDFQPPALLDVLIVEDDEDAAELMRALFSAVGHRTRVARDGVTGLAEVLSRPPDVAFIDIGLPRMDGYEVARTIRRSDRGASVYLVALTGYGRPEDRARALAAGFDVHLVKPLEIDRVNELMQQRPRARSQPGAEREHGQRH